MLFIIAGTKDGRLLAEFLSQHNFDVTVSVVSSYGKSLIQNLNVIDKPLDENALVEFISSEKFSAVIDASHPYAVNVSRNAMNACHQLNIPYLRFERAQTPITYDKIFHVDDYKSAAIKSAQLGKNIFLTTGSRNLKTFVEYIHNSNLIARVLPSAEVLSNCEKLGLNPKNICAMQGPFTVELNIDLFKHYNADVIVTKDGGSIGGVDTKISAAQILNLPVVMIDRPKIFCDNIAFSFEDVLNFLS